MLIHSYIATSSNEASTSERDQALRHQESALVSLGELYRDQKYVTIPAPIGAFLILCTLYRNAKGVSEVITLSRSFVSSTAKAKTAKLSTSTNCSYLVSALNQYGQQFEPSWISLHPFLTASKFKSRYCKITLRGPSKRSGYS